VAGGAIMSHLQTEHKRAFLLLSAQNSIAVIILRDKNMEEMHQPF